MLKDGNVRNTFTEELFDEESGVAPENYHPRTAIGVTANNKVVFFVCEGRSVTEGVKGMNMAMIANVLKSLGCVDAMNLDGGGSTCMLFSFLIILGFRLYFFNVSLKSGNKNNKV